ncbi:MAG TPA: hypothetical protein PKA81_12940 [Clostridia bacterium]|nr:hypothetical protein [Clostridia bacterium]
MRFNKRIPKERKTPVQKKKTADLAGFRCSKCLSAPYLAPRQTQYTTTCGVKKPRRGRETRRLKQTNVYFQKIQKKLVKNT